MEDVSRSPLTVLPTGLSCSLDASDVGGRLEEWSLVVSRALRRHPIDNGIRLTFERDFDLSQLVDLAEKEQRCCPFLSFVIGIHPESLTLDVNGPLEAQTLVAELLSVGSA
jgi:hypothetical protein